MTRTFGGEVKASRLGYRWCESIGAYLRIGAQSQPPFVADIAPVDNIPLGKCQPFRCWWEDSGFEEAFTTSPALRRLKHVKKPMRLLLDEDGRLLDVLPM